MIHGRGGGGCVAECPDFAIAQDVGEKIVSALHVSVAMRLSWFWHDGQTQENTASNGFKMYGAKSSRKQMEGVVESVCKRSGLVVSSKPVNVLFLCYQLHQESCPNGDLSRGFTIL